MSAVVLAIILVVGGSLLIVTAVMEWIGVMTLFTPHTSPRYPGCGHLRANPISARDTCWPCRHQSLDHALHLHHGR